MWKDNRGFAMFESILALAGILFLSSVIVPIFTTIIIKTDDAKLRAESRTILFEQIQLVRVTGSTRSSIIDRAGTAFHITWQGTERICVSYEARSSGVNEACISIE